MEIISFTEERWSNGDGIGVSRSYCQGTSTLLVLPLTHKKCHGNKLMTKQGVLTGDADEDGTTGVGIEMSWSYSHGTFSRVHLLLFTYEERHGSELITVTLNSYWRWVELV